MKAIIRALVLLLSAVSLAVASPLNVDKKGVAIQGYDPVAYQTQSRAVRGSTQFAASYEGAVYYFSNEAHLTKFKENLVKYVPAYGGYCAYGVSVNKLIKINPKAFEVYDGRLFLQLNKKIARKFSENTAGNVVKADSQWETLAAK